MITNERMNEIAEVIGSDEERAKTLFGMTPEEAAAELGKEGFTVTADELVDFGELVKSLQGENGELDESCLENVAGGGIGRWISWLPRYLPIWPVFPRLPRRR